MLRQNRRTEALLCMIINQTKYIVESSNDITTIRSTTATPYNVHNRVRSVSSFTLVDFSVEVEKIRGTLTKFLPIFEGQTSSEKEHTHKARVTVG